MKSFQRIGVFLDGSPADEAALETASRFAQIASAEKLFIGRVTRSIEQDGGGATSADDLQAQLHRHLAPELRSRAVVERYSGSGISDILRHARDDQLDLIVVGRRLPSDQLSIGSAFSKLARKAPCSVLAVPAGVRPHFGRVLVAVDFSPHSELALRMGVDIALASGSATPQVIAQNAFEIGYGFGKTGVSLATAAQQRTAIAQQQLADFVRDLAESRVAIETLATCAEDMAQAIKDVAASRKMDLIVIGSRGMSPALSVILGSSAERVLMMAPHPVMVVKKKGETLPLLESLLG